MVHGCKASDATCSRQASIAKVHTHASCAGRATSQGAPPPCARRIGRSRQKGTSGAGQTEGGQFHSQRNEAGPRTCLSFPMVSPRPSMLVSSYSHRVMHPSLSLPCPRTSSSEYVLLVPLVICVLHLTWLKMRLGSAPDTLGQRQRILAGWLQVNCKRCRFNEDPSDRLFTATNHHCVVTEHLGMTRGDAINTAATDGISVDTTGFCYGM